MFQLGEVPKSERRGRERLRLSWMPWLQRQLRSSLHCVSRFRDLYSVILCTNLAELSLVSTPAVPLLTHLFTHYSPSPSSHNGYPLCASITAYPTSLPLTRFLLDRGADPGCNDGYAVRLAIGKRDLKLVKMLVEREDDGGSGGGKKRKLGDRCKVDSQMCKYFPLSLQARLGSLIGRIRFADAYFLPFALNGLVPLVRLAVKYQARDISDYLMGKGVVPDMKTLLALENMDD
jgi:hypothetical protein